MIGNSITVAGRLIPRDRAAYNCQHRRGILTIAIDTAAVPKFLIGQRGVTRYRDVSKREGAMV